MLYSASRLGPLLQDLRLSSFCTAALSLTTAATLFTAPGFAQSEKPAEVAATPEITATTDCRDYQPGVLMANTKCEILKGKLLDEQSNALDAQGKALNAQGKQLVIQNDCISELVKFKKADPDKFKEMGFGTITRENACSLSGRLPKRAASL